MRAYELMVILSPEVEDRAVEPSLSKFLEIVTNEGGSIDKRRYLGPSSPGIRDPEEV